MNSLRIREYQQSDSAECCKIINTAIENMDGLNDVARQSILEKNVADRLHEELKEYYVVVCEDENRIYGLGGLDGEEIKRLYIDPVSQGKGVGTMIMQHLEDAARQRGITKVITDSSPSAESFYQKMGYESLDTDTLKKGGAVYTFVNMEKVL